MSGVAEQTQAIDGPARGARRGVISRFIDRVDAMPADGWWVYPGILIALIGWGQAVLWVSGQIPFGELDPALVVTAPYGPFLLFGMAVGRRIALRSLADFWPATGWPDRDQAVWRDRFVNVPPTWELAALALGGVAGVASLLSSPALLGAEEGRLAVAIAYLPGFVMGYAIGAVVFVVGGRWASLVARIHGEATAIDPHDPGPIHAFSRLTGAIGLITLFVVYYSFSANASSQAGNVPSLGFIVLAVVFGTSAFVVPLWGIHQRLVRLKDAMLRDIERRTTAVEGELFLRIDAGDLAATEIVGHALGSLTAARARVVALPTWPWSPQLFRGFVSALVLPVALYVLTRVAEVVFEL